MFDLYFYLCVISKYYLLFQIANHASNLVDISAADNLLLEFIDPFPHSPLRFSWKGKQSAKMRHKAPAQGNPGSPRTSFWTRQMCTCCHEGRNLLHQPSVPWRWSGHSQCCTLGWQLAVCGQEFCLAGIPGRSQIVSTAFPPHPLL